jgi:hypothetical protein
MSLAAHRSSTVKGPPLHWGLPALRGLARRAVAAAAKEVYPAVIAFSIFGTLTAAVLAIRLATLFARFPH